MGTGTGRGQPDCGGGRVSPGFSEAAACKIRVVKQRIHACLKAMGRLPVVAVAGRQLSSEAVR